MGSRRSDFRHGEEPDEGALRLGTVALDNPVATGGVLVMVLTATLIAANALSFQPGPHPAPLFGVAKVSDAAPVLNAAPEFSDLVREVQVSLQRSGYYNGPLDGLSGPKTDDAVRAYERATGLSETGEVSHGLLAHMLLNGSSVPAPSAAPRAARNETSLATSAPAPDTTPLPTVPVPPISPEAAAQERKQVHAVQQALADLGYGPLTVDGLMGNETASAIRRFELDRGMAITGRVRPEIFAALERTGGVKIPR